MCDVRIVFDVIGSINEVKELVMLTIFRYYRWYFKVLSTEYNIGTDTDTESMIPNDFIR